MIDIKLIRENPDKVKAGFIKKEIDCSADVDRILELDKERRDLIYKTETLKSEQNKASKQIPAMKKSGQDTTEIMARMNQLKEDIR